MEFQDRELYHLIQLGIEQYAKRKQPVLISHVACAGTIDPLSSFLSAQTRQEEKIVYWSDADNDLVLVGVGSTYSIKIDDSGSDRFLRIEKKWAEIKNKSIRSNGCKASQTGLVLLGGGAFDPIKPQSDRWRYFANAEFHLPRILLTCQNGKTWITINYMLQGNENPGELAEKLLEQCEWFFREHKHRYSKKADNPGVYRHKQQ